MTRPIKFRGRCSKQSAYSGEWIFGSLIIPDKIEDGEVLIMHAISDSASMRYHVDVHTIGQFTGLYDKNSKEIYEGDIVRICGYQNCQVVFERGAFCYATKWGASPFLTNPNFHYNSVGGFCEVKVIGNIHDNPELIEKIE